MIIRRERRLIKGSEREKGERENQLVRRNGGKKEREGGENREERRKERKRRIIIRSERK